MFFHLSLSVKGIDNFWKFRGIIDGFNESRRHIASGLKRMTDESMRAILFCTTPKLDSQHYSYIFGKPDTLGTDVNNVDFSGLGTMLHLEIQKGE